ncbi:MAG: hypothetical protein HOW97_22345, partial [Catenulispora sp.]|nr:hypothetical protein [Catenulispora sp.]
MGAQAVSEYQYYEFRALDWPLTDEQYDYVRGLSTRAEISRTLFVNEYQWGDFRGDPAALMDLCYDAHVYFANWGSRVLMFRLPLSLLTVEMAADYLREDLVAAHVSGDNIVLEFRSEEEPGDEWDLDGSELLDSIVGVRAELAAGDLRPLYIAWLAGLWIDEDGMIGEDEVVPPVPAGLGSLSAAQRAMAAFLRVDQDLLAASASVSGVRREETDGDRRRAMDSWLQRLTTEQKEDALRRLLSDEHVHVRAELLRDARPQTAQPPPGEISMEQLMAAASKLATAREAAEQAELERQRALREKAERLYVESRLAILSDRGERAWADVADLIAAKNNSSYDSAVRMLGDLAEISRRRGRSEQFA